MKKNRINSLIFSIFTSTFIFFTCTSNDNGKLYFNTSDQNKGKTKNLLKYNFRLNPTEYKKWIINQNNGLYVEKRVGKYLFKFQHLPTYFIIFQENNIDSINKQDLKTFLKEYEAVQYFRFIISIDDNISLIKSELINCNDNNQKLNYFNFEMQNDLKLIDGKDTLKCITFMFDQSYDLSPNNSFIIGFPIKKREFDDIINLKKHIFDDKILEYDDWILGTGKIKIAILKENLNSIPQIQFIND